MDIRFDYPVHFLKISRHTFAIFATFGLLDIAATMILIAHLGIGVETNPLIRYAFAYMNFYWFFIHVLLVLFTSYLLSRPTWNDSHRLTVKSGLFYLYVFILVNNWYQVAQLGYRIFMTGGTT